MEKGIGRGPGERIRWRSEARRLEAVGPCSFAGRSCQKLSEWPAECNSARVQSANAAIKSGMFVEVKREWRIGRASRSRSTLPCLALPARALKVTFTVRYFRARTFVRYAAGGGAVEWLNKWLSGRIGEAKESRMTDNVRVQGRLP